MWLTILIVAIGFELCTFALISIWFAIGAIFAFGTEYCGASLSVQLLVFIVVTVLSFVLTKPIVDKKILPKKKLKHTNVNALIGQQTIVTSTISNLEGKGEVKLNGIFWTARSQDDTPISEGTLIVVEKIEGVKLIVKIVVTKDENKNIGGIV